MLPCYIHRQRSGTRAVRWIESSVGGSRTENNLEAAMAIAMGSLIFVFVWIGGWGATGSSSWWRWSDSGWRAGDQKMVPRQPDDSAVPFLCSIIVDGAVSGGCGHHVHLHLTWPHL